MDELIYYSLHINYYALYGKLWQVRASKLKIYYLNMMLLVY